MSWMSNTILKLQRDYFRLREWVLFLTVSWLKAFSSSTTWITIVQVSFITVRLLFNNPRICICLLFLFAVNLLISLCIGSVILMLYLLIACLIIVVLLVSLSPFIKSTSHTKECLFEYNLACVPSSFGLILYIVAKTCMCNINVWSVLISLHICFYFVLFFLIVSVLVVAIVISTPEFKSDLSYKSASVPMCSRAAPTNKVRQYSTSSNPVSGWNSAEYFQQQMKRM